MQICIKSSNYRWHQVQQRQSEVLHQQHVQRHQGVLRLRLLYGVKHKHNSKTFLLIKYIHLPVRIAQIR